VKKVVFLGAKNIGYKCLKHLYSSQENFDFKITGVLTNQRGNDILDFCNENSLKVYDSLEDLLKIDNFDIGISVQYHKILKKKHIDKATQIFVNLHMAPLPEYRGCNQFSFAIINNDKIFGTTIHRLEEGIDSGDILFEERFKIPNGCWVEDLYKITFKHSISLFENSLSKIIKGNYILTPQKSLIGKRKSELHYRKEINEIKKINLGWSKSKIKRYIRATYMPGFEPPFIELGNQKFFFNKETNN